MAKIAADTLIMDCLKLNPDSAQIQMGYGMHCLGCAMAHGETIGEAVSVHGKDLEEMLALARPVQRGRLPELWRDRLEVCSCEDHVPHVERARKEDRPDRIDHVQVVDQDERGDHTAAEEHRDHKNNVKELTSYKFLLGHRVSGEQCNKYRDHCKCR